jgi:hypothetical protein
MNFKLWQNAKTEGKIENVNKAETPTKLNFNLSLSAFNREDEINFPSLFWEFPDIKISI